MISRGLHRPYFVYPSISWWTMGRPLWAFLNNAALKLFTSLDMFVFLLDGVSKKERNW